MQEQGSLQPSCQSATDKEIELHRYDGRAAGLLTRGGSEPGAPVLSPAGAAALRPILQSPYLQYESVLLDRLNSGACVLELGAGTGEHTGVLLRSGARVTATDISPQSLEVLKKRFPEASMRLDTRVADIEALPFPDQTFDLVTCAGVLSYGDPELVLGEIKRVLKRRGVFVCVDSLNENPIYRFNRWVHYLRGNRSRSTLERMPSLATIDRFRREFPSVNVWYFGSVSWLAPLAARVFGESRTALLSDKIDGFINTKRSAFKFVMVAGLAE